MMSLSLSRESSEMYSGFENSICIASLLSSNLTIDELTILISSESAWYLGDLILNSSMLPSLNSEANESPSSLV